MVHSIDVTVNNTTESKKMKILVSNTWAFEKEIARLNKKAVRVGFNPLTFAVLGRKTVTRRSITILSIDGEQQEEVRSYPVEVTEYDLTVPSVEEYRWVLAATITPIEDGTVFVDPHAKGFDTKPWQQADPCRCQHCNTRRARSLTYVVQNKDDGRTLQVGRTCFADYVGHEGLLKLEFVATVASMFGDGDEDFVYPGGGGSRQNVVSVRQVIAIAELLAETYGWENNVKDDQGHIEVEGTHRIAARYIGAPQTCEGIWKRFNDANDSIWVKVDGIIEQLKDIVSATDDFAAQLCYCAQFEVVPSKKAALVAYAGQFLRNAARKAALEAKKATMQYVGEIGARLTFTLKLAKLVSFDSSFGICYIHIFEDEKGNQLVWKTGTAVANEGETVTLKATVKAQEEYRGMKQTVISRAKVLA